MIVNLEFRIKEFRIKITTKTFFEIFDDCETYQSVKYNFNTLYDIKTL